MFSIIFPPLDPVFVEIGPLVIRWYALSYLAGFLLGWWQCLRLARIYPGAATPKDYDDFISWAVMGTVLGGRVGYILFYQFDYYLSKPLEIFQVWHGGMSFHGGILGVILSALIFTRRRKIKLLPFMDIVACVAPIGLGLGRLANFVNGELFGRPTDEPWGVIFPYGGNLPRHPSQLYEAVLEGLVLYLILMFIAWIPFCRKREGLLSGVFLIFYALFRFIVEFYRQPDAQLGFLYAGATMGQLLCVPMFVFGVFFVWHSFYEKVKKYV